jgi:predicted PhzF superfamily epimerase YddE/YHI9
VPDNLTAILGAEPVAVVRAGDDLLVELATVTAVRTLTPDIDALHELPFRGVIITAEAGGEIDGRHIDFVSRFFGCRIGAGEDPVTGSAHCGLAPYWAPRTGKTRMTGAQLSARGGIVDVELTGDRVLLTGPAVSVLEGELTV